MSKVFIKVLLLVSVFSLSAQEWVNFTEADWGRIDESQFIKLLQEADGEETGGMLLKYLSMPTSDPELLRALIKTGVTVNIRDADSGVTSLMWASYHSSNSEIIQVLLNNGADVNAVDENGLTPLMYAYDNPDIIQVLIDNGADIHARDIDRKTPLMYAQEGSNQEVFQLLIDNGATE